jgi:hypothetical protein
MEVERVELQIVGPGIERTRRLVADGSEQPGREFRRQRDGS